MNVLLNKLKFSKNKLVCLDNLFIYQYFSYYIRDFNGITPGFFKSKRLTVKNRIGKKVKQYFFDICLASRIF